MKKSLADTNKYIKEPSARAKLIRRSVVTSSAVEGIKAKLNPITGEPVAPVKKKINKPAARKLGVGTKSLGKPSQKKGKEKKG